MTLFAREASAAEPQLVVIVRDAKGSPAAARVESELADVGLAVQTLVVGADAAAGEPLSAIGVRAQAAAAIRIGAGGEIEVWTAGDPAAEQVVADAPNGDGERLVAIAAAELVRARLVGAAPEPVAPTAPVPPAPVPAPAVVAPGGPVAPAPDRLTAEAGAIVLAAGLDLAPTVDVLLAVAVRIAAPLSVELFGLVPLVPAREENGTGAVRMHTALAGGGLRLGAESRTGRLAGFAAPGFAALFLVLRGSARDGYEARDETVATAAPIVRLGGSIRLAPRLKAGLEVMGGIALSEVAVRLGGSEIARVGRPILGAALFVEVTLW